MNSFFIGDLEIKVPIIQGGMGICVSLSNLASAVANEGGIGVISAVGIGMKDPDYKKHYKESNKKILRQEIRSARSKTNGVLGVNIMMAVTDFDDLLTIALEEQIDVVIIGAGLFLKDPSLLPVSKTKFIPKVSSARVAKLIFSYWSKKYNRVPDAIVVEGPLCGGHVGFSKDDIQNTSISLQEIVSQTVDVVRVFEEKHGVEIPVIAGGGIYTGTDMYSIMQAGAKAVKMGTRFVTTNECDVSDEFKQSYIQAKKEDIVIIDSPVGLPGRVIANEYVKDIIQGKKKPVNCPWHCLKTCNYREVPFCISEALFNAAQGDLTKGFCFAGSNAHLATKIMSVHETIAEIKEEFESCSAKNKHL